MTKEIALQDNRIRSLTSPEDIKGYGKILKGYIEDNNLFTKIGNKKYAHVDGWKMAGSAFGLTAICDEPVKISREGSQIWIGYGIVKITKDGRTFETEKCVYASMVEPTAEQRKKLNISYDTVRDYIAYKCGCKVVNVVTQQVVMTGFAICTNLEGKKVTFDEYAIYSMCQTRTQGKGFRNLLGFIMNDAGFEATPAEEMDEVDQKEKEPTAKKKPVMTKDQFEKTKKAMEIGKVDFETVSKYYDYPEKGDYEKKLKALDKKLKKAKKNEKADQPVAP